MNLKDFLNQELASLESWKIENQRDIIAELESKIKTARETLAELEQYADDLRRAKAVL